jgi:glyoxylase-like metal-dependent hydrolase (beta-lactamase superfamily II)
MATGFTLDSVAVSMRKRMDSMTFEPSGAGRRLREARRGMAVTHFPELSRREFPYTFPGGKTCALLQWLSPNHMQAFARAGKERLSALPSVIMETMRQSNLRCRPLALCGLLLILSAAASAQMQDPAKVEIKSTRLAPDLYLLQGDGGNIVALSGPDGVLMVDDEFGALAEKIRAKLQVLGARMPVRFIINTHYHFDHTDGNLEFGQAGAVIIATDQVHARLAAGGLITNGGAIHNEIPPAPRAALPAITYSQELTVHANGESVRVHHYPNAHTDGDSVVFFVGAKVVHMGDIYVRYGFPFIDTNGGGDVRGMITACEDVIRTSDSETRIIPGHGDVATVTDLREYTSMLKDTSARVARALAAGKSLAQMKQEDLLGAWTARYSPAAALIDTDAFTEAIYKSLTSSHAPRVRRGIHGAAGQG